MTESIKLPHPSGPDLEVPPETPEERFVLEARSGSNLFLTGMAGTGKSTILRQWMAGLKGWWPDVTASTGIAALNVGGMTVHRWCGMRIGPGDGEDFEDYYRECFMSREVRDRVKDCRTLVIDEISMLSGRLFDYLDYHLQRIRYDDRPFGGIQLIVIGDFMQLPPVRERENEPYDWVFKSDAWEKANFQIVSLEKNWRQLGDPGFIGALAGVRHGTMDRSLMNRVKSNPPGDMPRLMTHNLAVDKWNGVKLSELAGELWVNKAEWVYDGDPDEKQKRELDAVAKAMLTPQELELKVGALVMFTTNDKETGTVNGEIGYVEETPGDGDGLVVRTKRGAVVNVGKWLFRFDHKKEFPHIAQYPLRLAYAMTIHKAQGLTLDNAYVDIRAAREPGQAYVALSRVRTLDGLRLKAWPSGIFVSNEAKKFYEEVRT